MVKDIFEELEPGSDKVEVDSSARDVFIQVSNLVNGTMGYKLIRLIDIIDIPGAKEEYDKIRKRFYSWMDDAGYLKSLVDSGKYTVEDIKKSNFRNKDRDECELIAIAKTVRGEYEIVTDDKGKVFLHPEHNLFDDYAVPEGIQVINSEEWLEIVRKYNIGEE